MTTPRYTPTSRRRADAVILADREFILQLPERSCGCHPAMPAERTPNGFACKGCGVGCTPVAVKA